MPIRNYFPKFHKLKSGAYSYVWTDKCEQLLPHHYKNRCLEYMMREPTPVHWIPDTREFTYDKHGTRLPVQNHPIHVRYPDQCNKGLWGGEGIVMCYVRKIKHPVKDKFKSRASKLYTPLLIQRPLYSDILDMWISIPCTNRAMDLIDDSFGLDYYILQNHERDLNSKLAMDLKRKMLIALATESIYPDDAVKRKKILKRYKEYVIPLEEAEWVGLSIKEALEKAEFMIENQPKRPLKELIEENFLKELEEGKILEEENKEDQDENTEQKKPLYVPPKKTYLEGFKSWFSGK